MTNTSLLTDRYELSMLQAFIADGSVDQRAVFETFTRKLPEGRRYGVLGGIGRLLPMIEAFRFDSAELDFLGAMQVVDAATVEYLREFRFTGTVHGYREGEVFFPNSPVLTVEGTLGECILLETLILSVLNHDSSIATTARRMVATAAGRPIIEMGSRRTHEESAVAAARAAYISGFAATSNLMAGFKHGIPTTGTAAHAFTLAHADERAAFESQVKAHGANTTLLVDTYDIPTGIRNAVEVAGTDLRAIRIDSGDLAFEATRAREILDSMGATETGIVVTSDLDEFVMKDLEHAPITGYGVGTKLVSSKPMGFVYKLVAIEAEDGSMRPVAKKAKDKASKGGRKVAVRRFDRKGRVSAETFVINAPWNDGNVAQVMISDGEVVHAPSIEDVREYAQAAFAALPEGEQRVWFGTFDPFLTAQEA